MWVVGTTIGRTLILFVYYNYLIFIVISLRFINIINTNNNANTPTVTLDVTDTSASASYQILRTHALTANTSEELITKPLVLEATDILKATMDATDSVHIAVSYLVIT